MDSTVKEDSKEGGVITRSVQTDLRVKDYSSISRWSYMSINIYRRYL